MIADVIFYNGKIFTMVDEHDICNAIAMYDGKIIATGTDEKICSLEATTKINLEGKCVFPGFTDTHQHLLAYAKSLLYIQLAGCRSIEEVQSRIRARAQQAPKGTWLFGRGFDQELFGDKKMFTKKELDEVSTEHPILVTRYCGHISVANSFALTIAKVGTHGEEEGTLDRDESGELNGILRESDAVASLTKLIPVDDYETLKGAVAKACYHHVAVGVTGVHTVGIHANQESVGMYQELEEEGRLPLRINISSDQYPNLGIQTGFGNEKIKIGYYKAFTDGSLGSRNAALFSDYSDDPGNKGILIHTQEELNEQCRKAYESGLQLGVHAIGDRGIEVALNAFEYASAEHPRKDPRFRLIHAMCCNAELLERMKRLKVVVDIQPPFISNTNIDWSLDRLGPDRIAWSYPWKTYIDNGLLLTGSSDSPVEGFNPIWGVFSIVNRKAGDGHPDGGFQPQECVSVYEAISMYTKNAAYASFEEHIKGTLEVGKLGDFVVLSDNPYDVNPFDIQKIIVEKTYLAGEKVFDRLDGLN